MFLIEDIVGTIAETTMSASMSDTML